MDYLYHYTNVQTLALILKYRTIRFSSLNQLDDLQEKECRDLKNAGQYIFVSCWTDDAVESIPLWKDYASIDNGVRIGLKKNPFKLHSNSVEDIERAFQEKESCDDPNIVHETYITYQEMIDRKFICPQASFDPSNSFLVKVKYTSDNEKLYPNLVAHEGRYTSINFPELGVYKNIHWEYQKEWRYKLVMLPIDLLKLKNDPYHGNKVTSEILAGKSRQLFKSYDMELSDSAFNNMEITLSPKIHQGSRVIVQELAKNFNPTAKINESQLFGLI